MPVLKQNDVFAGRYILSQFIGEGGFSEVWKARDQMADDAVTALKIYAPGKGLDDDGVQQFRREFSLTHHLSHPHLLKVYHFDIYDGFPYLVMPYCPYGSLSVKLRKNGVFSEKQVALVMSQIGSALEALHQQEIVHQDLKPDNILIYQPESYLLADFGISSQIRHTIRNAHADTYSLTVAYAPPERFDRQPNSNSSSDIFSLGVTLYEMCTNKLPWDGAGGLSLLKGALVPELPPKFPAELSKVLEACMSLEQSKRPTAAEIHMIGQHFLETGKWHMPKKKKNSLPAKRAFSPSLIAAALTLLVIAGAGFWAYQELYSQSVHENRKLTTTPVAATTEAENSNQLEDKLKTIEAQLIKTNQLLMQQDSINKVLALNNKDKEEVVSNQDLSARSKSSLQENNPERGTQASGAASKAGTSGNAKLELQKFLNQISDPSVSKALRSGWKQETLARFADGSVQVLDEAEDGTLKEYRAGIFLTLLLTSPHQVVVKEVEKDQNNKITGLRVSKQSIRAAGQ